MQRPSTALSPPSWPSWPCLSASPRPRSSPFSSKPSSMVSVVPVLLAAALTPAPHRHFLHPLRHPHLLPLPPRIHMSGPSYHYRAHIIRHDDLGFHSASLELLILSFVPTLAKHLILAVVRAIEAFVMSGNPTAYYNNFAHPLQVSKTCLFIAQTLLGDSVMVCRSPSDPYHCPPTFHPDMALLCHLQPPQASSLAQFFTSQHQHRYAQHTSNTTQLTFDPLLTVIAGIGVKNYSKAHQTLFSTDTRWLAIFMAMTLVINTVCSGSNPFLLPLLLPFPHPIPAAIVYRIYTTTSDSQSFRKFYPVISATVESGILYVTSIVALITTFLVQTPGVYIILESLVPIMVRFLSC